MLYDYISKIITAYFTLKNRDISGFLKGSSNGDCLSSDIQYLVAMMLLQVHIIGKSLFFTPSRYTEYKLSLSIFNS